MNINDRFNIIIIIYNGICRKILTIKRLKSSIAAVKFETDTLVVQITDEPTSLISYKHGTIAYQQSWSLEMQYKTGFYTFTSPDSIFLFDCINLDVFP